jgi:hypothetical protein
MREVIELLEQNRPIPEPLMAAMVKLLRYNGNNQG